MLATIDWVVIAMFLMITLGIGFYFRKQAGKSLADFFLAGRNLPWYIAGISMVATTFAADTPLLVTELIGANGISGNWLWWNMVINGTLTTFFFAQLWRRANILTELEFIDIRYHGKAARFLRLFKSVYLGIFLNCIVIGWVNLAMVKILNGFFGIEESVALFWVAGLLAFVAIYSALSGLLGIAFSDALQFILAMGGCIILSIILLNSEEIGGVTGLKAHFADQPWRLELFPRLGGSNTGEVLSISVLSFLAFIGIQWWASWYPGAEPGGGGYVAQRMMSAKDEKNAVFATLFFQIAHYALRPWPWIIIALCSLVLYPELTGADVSKGFVYAMKDHMPAGLKGAMFAAFLGAYMSTISTQLNWGASFIVNDFVKVLQGKNSNSEDSQQKSDIVIARIATVIIMLVSLVVTSQIERIDTTWKFLLGCGAGLGLVLILRWFWWRVNAWSEISATIIPLFAYGFSVGYLEDAWGEEFSSNNGTLVFTVVVTTIGWLIVTFLTPATPKKVLIDFYERIKPGGFWNPIQNQVNQSVKKSNFSPLFGAWISATVLIYSSLFFIGDLIFANYIWALIYGLAAIVAFYLTQKFMRKAGIF